MIALAFRFPAGRYHATPWGRHVNEADVEWPPSPWRILRALIATWHRKADAEHHPESRLGSLVTTLAGAVPGYRLPRATRAHTRHYMPVRQGKDDRPVLIYDAFVRVSPREDLVAVWPDDVTLDEAEMNLLDSLLADLGFLGRAESWVEARRLESFDAPLDCVASELSIDPSTGEATEPVSLLVPLPEVEYSTWRSATEAELNWDAMKPKQRRQLRATLPQALIDALQLDTSDIQAAGWSRPPGSRFVTYQRPYACFVPERTRAARDVRSRRAPTTTARLVLAGRPLPRIEDAVRIGELARRATLFHAEHATGTDGIPWTLSGHDQPEGNRHGHAFYLPEANDDGRIEHILIHAPLGLGRDAIRTLDRIRRLYEKNGNEWQVALEHHGPITDFEHSAFVGPAKEWLSMTPYLHPWFCKKRFGIEDQIRRECRERQLPEPDIARVPTVIVKGRERRPVHFHRFRTRRGLTQPDTQGSFWRLSFPEPIDGPLALGFGCHFGLGTFRVLAAP